MVEVVVKLKQLEYPYVNSSRQRYSKQLFYEAWVRLAPDQRVALPPFTLHDDHPGLINLGREYLADLDPSGYTTATRLFGDYDYWTYLKKSSWFLDALEIWNAEMDAKLYSEAMSKIRDLATGSDSKALSAAKFLANKDYKRGLGGGSKTRVRGRPSNEEVAGELKRQVEDQQLVEAAIRRIK